MKNKMLAGMLLLACFLCQYACKPGVKPNPTVNSAPLYLYSFEEKPALSTDNARERIKEFLGETNFENLVKSDDGTVYFTSQNDLSANLEQDLNTGNFTFNKGMKKYMGDYVPKLPGSTDAVKLTETFLREKGLFPKNQAQLKLVHQGGLRSMNVVDGSKAGTIIDKMITLNYGRIIDSMSVIGPGSKIVVQVGDQGEVMGMVYRWRELNLASKKAIEPAALISQREAEAAAKNQIASEYGSNATYTVKKSYKAYYDNNRNLLQPVYVFETTVTLADKSVAPLDYLCVIEAMKNSPEPLQLIAVDGRAKEAIRNIKQGDGTGGTGERKNKD